MGTELRKDGEPSVASLVSGIVGDVQELIKQQFMLLGQEVKQELRQAKRAATSLSIGVGIGVVALFFVLLTIVFVLHEVAGLRLWASMGIVAAFLAAAAAGFFFFGRREAAEVHLAPPPQTATALKENVEWIKEQTTGRT